MTIICSLSACLQKFLTQSLFFEKPSKRYIWFIQFSNIRVTINSHRYSSFYTILSYYVPLSKFTCHFLCTIDAPLLLISTVRPPPPSYRAVPIFEICFALLNCLLLDPIIGEHESEPSKEGQWCHYCQIPLSW